MKDTIETKCDLKVENLFAVSAKQALEGDFEASGFREFLPALESFLVRSSGVARVQTPHNMTRNNWNKIHDRIEGEIKGLDSDLGTLRDELGRLQRDEEKIRTDRDRLLLEVENRISDLISIGTDGMEALPVLIQEKVEATVDELDTREKLEKAGDYIQPVIKEVVAGWLTQKEEQLRSVAQQLHDRVAADLKEILDTIQPKDTPLDYRVDAEAIGPEAVSSLSGGSVIGSSLHAKEQNCRSDVWRVDYERLYVSASGMVFCWTGAGIMLWYGGGGRRSTPTVSGLWNFASRTLAPPKENARKIGRKRFS